MKTPVNFFLLDFFPVFALLSFSQSFLITISPSLGIVSSTAYLFLVAGLLIFIYESFRDGLKLNSIFLLVFFFATVVYAILTIFLNTEFLLNLNNTYRAMLLSLLLVLLFSGYKISFNHSNLILFVILLSPFFWYLIIYLEQTPANYLRYTNILPVLIIASLLSLRTFLYQKRIILFSIFLLTAIAASWEVIFSPSRTAAIFTIFFIYIYILYLSPRLLITSTLVMILFIVFGSELLSLDYNFPWFERFSKRYADGTIIGNIRLDLLGTYFQEFENFYIHGFGLFSSGDALYSKQYNYPHNFVLELISDLGILGLMLGGVILGYLGMFYYHFFQNIKNINEEYLFVFLVLSYYLAVFLKSSSAYSISPIIFFLLLHAKLR